MVLEPLLGPEGRTEFLLGNEAVARGIYEAGVSVASTYPGTPSSEIGDVLYRTSAQMGIKFEYCTNEKVALEVAAAASAGGLRSFVFMKHVGLNVAMDSFVSLSGSGVKGGMVVLSADDPSMHSSQNEQDNRFLGKFAKVIVVEPSSPQELKDFILYAFDLSEEVGHPVLVRSVTRISHIRAPVRLGKAREKNSWGYRRNTSYVLMPENAYAAQASIADRIERAASSRFREAFDSSYGESPTLIITSGAAYNYIDEALEMLNVRARILKIGMSFPLNRERVMEEIGKAQRVVFVEEGGPFIEEQVLALCALNSIKKEFYGKMNGFVPTSYEMDVDRTAGFLSKIFGIEMDVKKDESIVPRREPVLCPGCPHRATYYVARMAMKQAGIRNPIAPTDIGCYTLGYYEPYQLGDFCLSMGSSVGSSSGFAMNSTEKVVSFIGDSTFFHAGIPALVNAYHNNHNFVLVIMDNSVTAMTGGQPTPETSPPFRRVDIESVVRGIGIKNVFVMDPYDLKNSLETFKKALRSDDLAVVISRRECALEADRKRSPADAKVFTINQDKCNQCYNCVKNFSCAAFYTEDGKVYIDGELCDGCSVCSEPLVCPFNAIEVKD
ncbi:MAG: indolepyruvate ferredoxin oxidoreductase subunit alpha [Candidatus Thermoplasmatota archaeon]|jgi:indolepyruvate ferredoxin oxidoreductase alpha subunit|nr:indolepyruvate ferredoxin oxidoreductase subunit alpha [Candidatus Thermoplasmatota archaeon]